MSPRSIFFASSTSCAAVSSACLPASRRKSCSASVVVSTGAVDGRGWGSASFSGSTTSSIPRRSSSWCTRLELERLELERLEQLVAAPPGGPGRSPRRPRAAPRAPRSRGSTRSRPSTLLPLVGGLPCTAWSPAPSYNPNTGGLPKSRSRPRRSASGASGAGARRCRARQRRPRRARTRSTSRRCGRRRSTPARPVRDRPPGSGPAGRVRRCVRAFPKSRPVSPECPCTVSGVMSSWHEEGLDRPAVKRVPWAPPPGTGGCSSGLRWRPRSRPAPQARSRRDREPAAILRVDSKLPSWLAPGARATVAGYAAADEPLVLRAGSSVARPGRRAARSAASASGSAPRSPAGTG